VEKPKPKGEAHSYQVPADAAHRGNNLIEVRPKTEVKITWVEIAIGES